MPANKSVIKSAGAMASATFLSRIMGLVREQVFAFLFGAGDLTDAYNVAFRIPNLLRDLFAEGAMSSAFVPVFTRARQEQGERRAWRVAGLVFRVLFVTVTVVALLGVFFAPELVSLYASAFKKVPGKFELTVEMTRIMFPFFPFVALSAAFMGILNACGVFFLPAFASALFNITSVAVGVTCAMLITYFASSTGWAPIEGMAIGVVVGGIVQACCQLPALYRKGYTWKKKLPEDLPWNQDHYLKQMLWMMIPGTVGLAATQVNILVNTVLATSQGSGAVSWLTYAFRLMQFPIGIFGVSLASATLPKISQQWVRKDVGGVSDTLVSSMRTVFAINFPASAGLIFLGYPIIELIFEYGRFTSSDTQATSTALAVYALGLTAYSLVKLLVPACYALNNTRLPVISSLLAVFITICLNLLMVKPFGYWGLALGTSLAAVCNAVFLLFAVRYLLRKKGGDLNLIRVSSGMVQYLVVGLVMGIICYFSARFLTQTISNLFLDQLFGTHFGNPGIVLVRTFRMGLLVSEGVFLVLLFSRLFRLDEVNGVFDLFKEKMKNKLRRNST